MGQRRVGGGILATVGIAVPVIVQLAGWHLPGAVAAVLLIVCFAASVVGLMLAFWPKPRSSAGTDSPRRDVKVTEALAYAVRKQWGLRVVNLQAGAFIDVSAPWQQTRQLAADGEMTFWGKSTPHGIYEVIPAEYWRDHQLEWFDLLRGEPRTEAVVHGASHQIFWDVMGSRAEFERHFPR